MTLQRLLREDSPTVPASPPSQLRAKVIHGRLRSVPYVARANEHRDRACVATARDTRTHESSLHEPLLGEVTRVLSSSLDYTSALREVSRVVSHRLGCGCIIELREAGAPTVVAHQPPRARPAKLETLAALVADVVARNRSATATRMGAFSDDRRGRAVAECARQASGAEWVTCAPLPAHGGEPLGAVTMFGTSSRVAAPHDLAREIAQRAAVAVTNGRLYRAALLAAHERQRVLSLVAHELKNPLGVILMGAAQALHGSAEAEPCSCRRGELEAIHRSAKRMKKLVGDLLDLASIDAGKLALRPTSCDVATAIAGALADVSANASAVSVTVVADRMSDPTRAWVDPDRLSQVLVNILSNAVKFTPRGGHVRVRSARVDPDEIVIAVEDSGRGIAPEDLEHVFEQFWQASDTATTGSGLGLAICRSIVELSGGRIWAQSTLGVGTTVYFTLPAAASA
jgi:signal transduction histidine kinase